LRATVRAEVLVPGDIPIAADFIVDIGSSYTLMSADRARDLGLSLPDAPVSLPITTADGTVTATVYDGELRVRFPQLSGHVFRLYCVFVEGMNPHALPLLGLNDFLDVFRVTFDGRYSPEAPVGQILFETI
jgi:hypothetical protein